MIAVVSHAWLRESLDGTDHLAEYLAIATAFGEFHRSSPGYRGRRLMQGVADARHLVNIRWFDQVADYEAMVARPGYAEWIHRLSDHVEARDPAKEYLTVILDEVEP